MLLSPRKWYWPRLLAGRTALWRMMGRSPLHTNQGSLGGMSEGKSLEAGLLGDPLVCWCHLIFFLEFATPRELGKKRSRKVARKLWGWDGKALTLQEEDNPMAKKHMKRCPIPSIIREMQVKMTMRYHYQPTTMKTTKRTNNTKCWRGHRASFRSYAAGGSVKCLPILEKVASISITNI